MTLSKAIGSIVEVAGDVVVTQHNFTSLLELTTCSMRIRTGLNKLEGDLAKATEQEAIAIKAHMKKGAQLLLNINAEIDKLNK